MLELIAVSRRAAGERLLEGVSAVFSAGEPHVVLGLHGGARTALFRTFQGRADYTGTIRLQGKDLRELKGPRTPIEPPRKGLPPSAASVRSVLQKASRQKADSSVLAPELRILLDAAGLLHLVSTQMRDLSQSERIRVGIVAALAKRPGLLLLNAPADMVAEAQRDALLGALSTLLRQQGAVVLYAATRPDDAEAIGGTVAVLAGGRLLQQGATADLFDRPLSLEVARATTAPALNTLPLRIEGGVARLADGAILRREGLVRLPNVGGCTLAFRPRDLHLARPAPSALRFPVRAAGSTLATGQRFSRLEFAGSAWLAVEEHNVPAGLMLNAYVEPTRIFAFDNEGRAFPETAEAMLFDGVGS